MDEKFTIKQLSENAELSRRTIRYCVQKGVMKPPIGRGRWSFYNYHHLEMLREIKRLRGAGLSFTKIREHLRNQIPEEWIIYRLNPGLEIHFSRDVHERFLQKQNVSHIMKLVSEFFPEE